MRRKISADTYTADRLARIRGTEKNTFPARKRKPTTPPTRAVSEPKTNQNGSPFVGLCCLCGAPAKRTYCHAHSWAEGT